MGHGQGKRPGQGGYFRQIPFLAILQLKHMFHGSRNAGNAFCRFRPKQ